MKVTFVLVASLAIVSGADERVSSITANGFVSEAWIVPAEAFTTERLQERARAFLRSHATASFGQLELSVGPGVRFYGGKGTDHVSVENYFYRLHFAYPDGVQAYGDIACLIKIGRSAILRIRKDGRVSAFNVSDAAFPLPGSAEGYEILHLAPLFFRRSVVGVEVFIRSRGGMTREGVRKLAKELRVLRPQLRIWVFARTDAWFVTHPGFPFLYAFDDPVMVPTLEEYQRSAPGIAVVDPEN
jgi:hypothetical protein